jgi:beta-glucosidase
MTDSNAYTFPENFIWGAATAAYQIEGAHDADGKGASIWDVFCEDEGRILNGDHGRVACDHYHRYKEDVGIMRDIGLQAYRMSLSWSRILPEGTGSVNEAGLDFYDRLIDELLAAGIAPWVTLFHWDLPHALHSRGGWLNRKSADWFAKYAEIAVKRLGDRVSHWMTLNEPQCIIVGYWKNDNLAPALAHNRRDILQINHNLLRAHAQAVPAMRAVAPQALKIGWAPVGVVSYPETETPEDIEAARRSMFSIPEGEFWNNSWYADPVLLGEYPEDGLRVWGELMPQGWETDLAAMKQPIDFYGANIYNGRPVRQGEKGAPEICERPAGFSKSLFDWPVEPKSLYWGPKYYHERYGLPVVVTENGMSCHDWVGIDGAVHDPQRIDFLQRYLRELSRAAQDGVPVDAYFLWSLLDNFEWAYGYKQRLGLVHVDYESQKRTPKDSAGWYAEVIRTNGGSL